MLIDFATFLRDFSSREEEIIILDKDGTLTFPNQALTTPQARALSEFLRTKKVVILTARDKDICKTHIIDILPEYTNFSNLSFACSNGSEIYSYTSDTGFLRLSYLPGDITAYTDGLREACLQLQEKNAFPLTLEIRSQAMMAIVCIPRSSDEYARKNYDPTGSKRLAYIEILRKYFPIGEILPGGSTSIDISLFNKLDGIRHIYNFFCIDGRKTIFFGDSFDTFGNDAPVLGDASLQAVRVSDPDEMTLFFSRYGSRRMPSVVTIGGGNGHSNMLSGIHKVFEEKIILSAIVSMSDDGRTTGRLMRYFSEDLGIHFPPPGDLRRCLYFLSHSSSQEDFQKFFEMIIPDDIPISELSLGEICQRIGAYEFLKKLDFPYFEARLPINHSLEGHKFGNIFMGMLFYHLGHDYDAMMRYMHTILDVRSQVIPVTTDPAYIQARLADGTLIERQDNISNVGGYHSRIVELSLMPGSHEARYKESLKKTLKEAQYIIIAPGDLYTSTISNLIIGGMQELIRDSHAQIIFIANNTNKGGETSGYTIMDFVLELEKYLGKPIDYLIANNHIPDLSPEDMEKLKSNISVKGGEYISLIDEERDMLTHRGTKVIEGDFIDRSTLYKHDTLALANTLEKIIVLG